MAFFGIKCGTTKIVGNQIQHVYNSKGEDSKLYSDILKHIKELPKEEIEKLRDTYRSWEGEIARTVDNNKDLSLMLYARSFSENFKSIPKEGGEHTFESIKDKLFDSDKMNQLPDNTEKTIPSKQSDVTTKQHEEFLMRNGFDIKPLFEGSTDENGNKITPENSIDFTNKLVKVVDGDQNIALGEESTHLAVRMIKQKFPKLFQEMMNRIGRFNLYEDVVNTYKDNKDYQIDGKPNILKLKEETVGKVLNEYITKGVEGKTEKPEMIAQAQTWWKSILDNLKSLFNGTGYNPFKQAAKKFENKELDGKLEKIKTLKNELQYIITGDGETSEGSSIKSIQTFLRGSKTADKKNIAGRTPKDRNETKQELKKLKEYIDTNNLWYKDKLDKTNKLGSGSEADVYLVPGTDKIHKTNNLIYYNSWEDYFNSLLIHNKMFPETAYKLKGFIIHEETGQLQSVVEQNYIKAEKTNQEDVIKFLNANGFEHYEEEPKYTKKGIYRENYLNKELGILLYDLHDKNVLKANNGALFFIDTDFYPTKDFYNEESDKMYQLSEGEEKRDKLFTTLEESEKTLSKPEDSTGQSHYEVNNEKVPNRVTDLSHKYLEGIFKNKQWLKDKIVGAINELKKKFGIGGHADIENILERHIDKTTGLLKVSPDTQGAYLSKIDPENEVYYNNLQKHLFGYIGEGNIKIPGLVDSFPEGTKFLWEKKVYDPNRIVNGKRGLAGTIDFMAIKPNGKVSLFDWKFIGKLEQNQAIRDYMKKSYDIQMENYIDILQKAYGLGKDDVEQVRIIPISVKYSEKKGEEGKFKSLKIGTTDYESVSDKESYLLPYPTSSEKSGDKKIDDMVQRLSGLIDSIKSKPASESEREIKENKIHNIEKAILHIRLSKSFKPLMQQAKLFNEETAKKIDSLKVDLKNTNFNEIKTISDFSEKIKPLVEMINDLQIYQNLGDFINYFEKGSEEREELLQIEKNSKVLFDKAKDLNNQYWGEFAKLRSIYNLLAPQRKLDVLGAEGRVLSKSQSASMQAFFDINSQKQNLVENTTNEMLHRLETIDKALKEMGNFKKISDLIEAKDEKEQGTNTLIREIDTKFNNELHTRLDKEPATISADDIKFVKDNIDHTAFSEWANKSREERYVTIDKLSIPGDPDKVAEIKQGMKDHIYKETDLTKDYAWTVYNNVRKFPIKDKWYSKEFKEILKPENKPIKDFYDFILDVNEEAAKSGYIQHWQKKSFLPWIEKSLSEKVGGLEGRWNVRDKIMESLTEAKQDNLSERLDPVTGRLIPVIPKYFTNDISIEKNGETDFSNVSDELIKNMGMYAHKVIDYKAKSDIEDAIEALQYLEKYKGMLEGDSKGKLTGRVVEQNENLKYLEDAIKTHFYDKSVLTSFDFKGGTTTVEGKEREFSAVKAANSLKIAMSLDVLGFNFVTSIFRTLTTTATGLYNAGQHYTLKQFMSSYYDFCALRALKDDHKVTIGLLKDFLPVEENLIEGMRELSANLVTKQDFQETLMKWVKSAHNIVQYTNFISHIKNAIVINGKLMNAREYYRNTKEYKDKYKLSEDERSSFEKSEEEKISKLIEQHGLLNKASFDEKTGKMVYNGLDLNDFSVGDFKNLIRVKGRILSGNISENDQSHIRSNSLIRQMFLFTNWLPQSIDQRFGGLAYNRGLDTYEYGRMRMCADILFNKSILPKIGELINMHKANDAGVKALNDMYIRHKNDYLEKTGQDLNMTPEQFYDMVRSNIKIQTRELLSLLTFAGLALGLSALLPKKDNKDYENAQGFFTFMKRVSNRAKDELELFYDPSKFAAFGTGSKLPFLGYLTDLKTAISSVVKEGYGLATDDDKILKTTHPVAHFIHVFPIGKPVLDVLAISDPEMAKYLGIHYNSEPIGSGR